ncbi:protein of unknown function [Petrocella atlantisensis]|uniref:Uncharacterized protein n=1 Tax=Petrocella atlantisensis TaxID=2173034 RepID=A0A3P7PDY1_9FIRM|nr:protein of unknown function [Petrocella atlantisensis]
MVRTVPLTYYYNEAIETASVYVVLMMRSGV